MSPRYGSSDTKPNRLGQPLSFPFAKLEAPNRFLKAAMTERLSSWSVEDLPKRGIPSPELIKVYQRWGEGGFGVILTGNIMMEYDQLEAPGNPIIPRGAPIEGERFEAFKALAKEAQKEGALCVGQVSHPGRQTENRLQPDPVSASDVQLEGNVMGMNFNKPHPASSRELKDIISGFTHSAVYLQKAGYSGIELHAAHGYLLAQFLAQTTNRRSDTYGGSLPARASLITEIATSIRSALDSSTPFLLGIKLNSVEFQEGGFQPAEARELCHLLEENGFDFVELSGGTYESLAFNHKRESTKARESFFLDFAQEIVPVLTKTKTYVTGGFKTAGKMEEALDSVDGIGLARAACQEPDLPKKILAGEVQGAIQQRFDENNFGLTNVVAGSQIKQIGKGQKPMDGSSEEVEKGFGEDMQQWMGEMGEQGLQKYGYVDLHKVHAVPYAGVASS